MGVRRALRTPTRYAPQHLIKPFRIKAALTVIIGSFVGASAVSHAYMRTIPLLIVIFHWAIFCGIVIIALGAVQRSQIKAARRAQVTEAVAKLGQRALGVDEPNELLGAALRVAVEALGADYGTALRRMSADRVRVAAEIGPEPMPQGSLLHTAPTKSMVMHVLREQRPYLSNDLRRETGVAPPMPLILRGILSTVAVPVVGPEGTVGILGLHATTAHRFHEEDVILVTALANVVAMAWAHAAHRETIAHQALHDALTGLPNRALFFDRLDHALRRLSREKGQPIGGVAVMMVDLDGFKAVNDTYGHTAGDAVLAEVAARFSAVVRPGDTVARLGGDEFALLCDHAPDKQTIATMVHRLQTEVARPISLGASKVTVKASVGVALSRLPKRTQIDATTMVRDADTALYAAKELTAKEQFGGFRLFDERLDAQARTRVQLETELRDALSAHQFELYYQPVRDPQTQRVLGMEALVRWNHPVRGVILPSEFIPVAEGTGLIVPLGRWILDTACQQAARWQQMAVHYREHGAKVIQLPEQRNYLRRQPSHTEHLRRLPELHQWWVSVNISARQLDDPGLASEVQAVLSRSGLPPHLLSLELTETAVMDTGPAGLYAMNLLRDTGATLVLDDFGTGFSSLTHLTRLPIGALKVDRSFVAGMGSFDRDSVVVSSVAAIGAELGLRVIAEGVETPLQLENITALGCYGVQGFLLDRPQSAGELEQRLFSSAVP